MVFVAQNPKTNVFCGVWARFSLPKIQKQFFFLEFGHAFHSPNPQKHTFFGDWAWIFGVWASIWINFGYRFLELGRRFWSLGVDFARPNRFWVVFFSFWARIFVAQNQKQHTFCGVWARISLPKIPKTHIFWSLGVEFWSLGVDFSQHIIRAV